MNPYQWVLFLHVLGTVTLFASIAVEGACVLLARRTRKVGAAGRLLLLVPGRVAPAAMVMTGASGGWMMATVWGHQAWIEAGALGLVAMGVAGLLSLRRLRRARRAPEVELELAAAVQDPVVAAMLWQRTAIGISVLALMTVRPEGGAAWALLAAGALAGVFAHLIPRAAVQVAGAVEES